VPRPSPFIRHSRYAGVAFEFSGAIAGGAVLGWLLDDWLGSEPTWIIACTLLGVAGGFVRLVRLLQRFDRVDRGAKH